MKGRLWRGSGLVILAGILLLAVAEARDADWTELNPAFEGAAFVKDSAVCAECHAEVMAPFAKTTHARAFGHSPQGELEENNCESCHGPRSKHAEEPDAGLAISVEQFSTVCLQCHQDDRRMHWQSSLHKTTEVGCISCHTVMEKRSDTALLAEAEQAKVCSDCHAGVIAKLNKSSHHPVREGRIDCSSCHNPHGGPNPGMLVQGTTNETCTSCHQEKRGPFLWEHPPAREDCLTCHEPHGSNNRFLLTTQSANQCVVCHQYGGHVNEYRYNRVSTPYGNGCVNCHVAVHGSNHPSGAKLTR